MFIMDLGMMNIGSYELTAADDQQLAINIYGDGDSAVDLDIFDLILLPVNEWAGDFSDPLDNDMLGDRSGTGVPGSGALDIDSIDNPKVYLRSPLHSFNDLDEVRGIWQHKANGPAILQNGVTQRLWFLAMDNNGVAPYEAAFSLQIWRAQRYESLRGAG